MANEDYRDKVYRRYAETVQIQEQPASAQEIERWGAPWIAYLDGWLPARRDARILDVACGAGKLLRLLASRGYTQVQGVDISPQQVELARRLHPQVEQANTLDFLDRHRGEFDLITGIDIVEHLTKPEILLFMDKCRDALAPGGRLILQTPNGESPWRGANWHGDFTHETCLNAKSMGQVFSLAGFKNYEAREQGPVPHGLASTVRFVLWKAVRARMLLLNFIETGSPGSGVLTRVFIGSGVKA